MVEKRMACAMTCTSPGLPVLSEVLDFVCTTAEVDLFLIVTFENHVRPRLDDDKSSCAGPDG